VMCLELRYTVTPTCSTPVHETSPESPDSVYQQAAQGTWRHSPCYPARCCRSTRSHEERSSSQRAASRQEHPIGWTTDAGGAAVQHMRRDHGRARAGQDGPTTRPISVRIDTPSGLEPGLFVKGWRGNGRVQSGRAGRVGAPWAATHPAPGPVRRALSVRNERG
jgi:hypothetical protein